MNTKKSETCEHPDHLTYASGDHKMSDLFLHSTHLYWPEEEVNRPYFWACNACLFRDYEKWEGKELLHTIRSPYKNMRLMKGNLVDL